MISKTAYIDRSKGSEMHWSEWLHERLALGQLDKTVVLTYSRRGSWMGLRVLETFQLAGDGSFLWEWEDEYARVPYQKQRSMLDMQTASSLFSLFQTGLASLLPFSEEKPLSPLPPDSLPAHFTLAVGGEQASYGYRPAQPGSFPRGSSQGEAIKHLLEQFARIRKQQRDEHMLP